METRVVTIGDRRIRCSIYWAIVIFIVIVDQATKAAAREVLEEGPRVLLPGIVNLMHVENTGAAFSLGQGSGVLFSVLAIAFLIAVSAAVWRMSELPQGVVVAIGMIAGGAFGNLIDRVMHGSVTDFIAATFISFPVFNVADICITLGVVLFILSSFVWEPQDESVAKMDAGSI